MKKAFYILGWIILLSSCLKIDQNQIETSYVLNAVLIQGEPIEGIRLSRTLEFDSPDENSAVSGASITMWRNGIQLEPLVENTVEPGMYELPSLTTVVSAGDVFEIRVEIDGSILTSKTTVPPAIPTISLSTTEVLVDSENGANDEVLQIAFSGSIAHSTLITLETTEENPMIIPFEFGGGNFNLSYSLPQPYQQHVELTLFANDFYFYGEQQLSFYSISEQYAEAYLYSPNGPGIEVFDVPDNVEGGNGVFTSAAKETVIITVSEQ